MDEKRDQDTLQGAQGAGQSGDYGYDEAHDVRTADAHAARIPTQPQVRVVTESDDEGQDYGYDLAHDIPPA